MTQRVLLPLAGILILASAALLWFNGEHMAAGAFSFAAMLVFWFAPRPSEPSLKLDGPAPSPSEVKAYRQEHPGTSISEAISELQRGE